MSAQLAGADDAARMLSEVDHENVMRRLADLLRVLPIELVLAAYCAAIPVLLDRGIPLSSLERGLDSERKRRGVL